MKHGEGVYVFKDKGQLMEGIWVNGTPKVSIIRDMDAEYDADMMANDYIHLTRQYRIPEVRYLQIFKYSPTHSRKNHVVNIGQFIAWKFITVDTF